MPLQLAIDFGTATTCMATVPDLTTFRAEVIPIEEGASFSPTEVFLDVPDGRSPLVVSRSHVGRHPLGAFGEARDMFGLYWNNRRQARSEGVRWAAWQESGREQAMLLSYFKPELADNPARIPLLVPRVMWGPWDGLGQSQELHIALEERSMAAPDPDTNDLIAATAAVLRRCVERALATMPPGERIAKLAIGVPSTADGLNSEERNRSAQRRHDAVALAGIASDFGTSDFECRLYGEAEAAAWSVEIESDEPTLYLVVIDVGAGTTDLALVEYGRDRRGGYRVKERVLTRSLRFAGRNLNHALTEAFRHNEEFHQGIAALDRVDKRAWQHLIYSQVETVKCGLNDVPGRYQVDFSIASASEFGTLEMDRIAWLLRKSAFLQLSASSPIIRDVSQKTLGQAWRPVVRDFIQECVAHVHGRRHLLHIEKVGGAFRFKPLHAELVGILLEVGLPSTNVRFRDERGSAQTMVARGLARWLAEERG